jgi:hypothetical protein
MGPPAATLFLSWPQGRVQCCISLLVKGLCTVPGMKRLRTPLRSPLLSHVRSLLP